MNSVKLSFLLLLTMQGASLYGAGSLVTTFKQEGKNFWQRDDDSVADLMNRSSDELYEFDSIAPILSDAVRQKRTDVVELFGNFYECEGILDYPLNKDNQTALMLAAGTGQIGLVKYLDGKGVTFSLVDGNGDSALAYAKKYKEKKGDACCYIYLNQK